MEEAIVVVKGDHIKFSNDIFKELLQKVSLSNQEKDDDQILDIKMFKIFREDKEAIDASSPIRSHKYKAYLNDKLLSLSYLMNKPESYFLDKIFEI